MEKKTTSKKQTKAKVTDKDIIQKLEQEIKDLKTEYLLKVSDLENDRKLFDKEKNKFIQFANQNILLSLINILDTFYMAMETPNPSKEVSNFLVGFEMINQQFKTLLENSGVKEIQVKVGEELDSSKHQSLDSIESDQKKGTIAKIAKKGFTYHDTLLRPVMVYTSKGKK